MQLSLLCVASSHISLLLSRVCCFSEGYEGAKPNLPLGFYVYNYPLALRTPGEGQGGGGEDDSDSGSAGGMGDGESGGVTTVTHFNLIHYKCHTEALKADKKLKPPKSEWEGATIRNQHTLTNNLWPILQPPQAVLTGESSGSSGSGRSSSGMHAQVASMLASAAHLLGASASGSPASSPSSSPPSAASGSSSSALMNPASPLWDSGSDLDSSLDLYNSAVETYWGHIAFQGSFVASRLEILQEDTRALLSRFAMQESFSTLAKGGGKVR